MTTRWNPIATGLGRALSASGILAWSALLVWQLSMPVHGLVGITTLALEVLALVAAAVITAAMWTPRHSASFTRRDAPDRHRTLPETLAVVLSVDPSLVDVSAATGAMVGGPVGEDDTGEIVWARRGLHVFRTAGRRGAVPSVGDAAWAIVALEGLRRMLCVALLVVVLLTGLAPFDVPSWPVLGAFAAALGSVSVGHWLLSGGRLVPGSRLVWSMASIGAGLGDGVSRSTLPIRWMATMATMVVLNLTISLRGFSDRWTHGLGAMSHDARVAAMSFGLGLVTTGFLALRTLPQPELGFYGATHRLEETSTRRLALGSTVGIAVFGFVAGVVPGGTPL